MKIFEYMVKYDVKNYELNTYGSQGWELIQIVQQWSNQNVNPSPGMVHFYFKREKQ